MTLPADIAVHCGSQLHEFGPFAPAPEAEYWLDWHGCLGRFACTSCANTVIIHALAKLDRGEDLMCGHCYRQFHTVAAFVTSSRIDGMADG